MQRADAIVLLGCRITPSGRPAGAAARRVDAAARAFEAGVAPIVIASGGRRWGSVPEAIALHRALVAAGVPDDAIEDELCSFSTVENAILSVALLRARTGLRAPRTSVVTCPWHLPRALQCFRDAGAEPLPFPTAPAPASLSTRAYRFAHEVVCRRLDARAVPRATLLAASAAAHFDASAAAHFDASAPALDEAS